MYFELPKRTKIIIFEKWNRMSPFFYNKVLTYYINQ